MPLFLIILLVKSFVSICTLDNTQKGFHSLIEAVLELEPSSLLFGMEATGHYHQALALFLSSLSYNVGLLNPLLTNRLKEVDLRQIKTNKIDAKVYY